MPACLLVASSGCSPSVKRMDRRDRGSPLVQAAVAQLNKGDKPGAIKAYKQALDSDPLLARVHLDLAFLLHDFEKDYVSAIYHYRRYMELRPETEKREMIDGRIREAIDGFVALHTKTEPARPSQGSAGAGVKVRTYAVKAGDTLSSIAADVYRDANAWKKIKDANNATLDATGKLRVGQILIIP